MMKNSTFPHALRKTVIESAIHAMEDNAETHLVYMSVFACDMANKESKMFIDVPMDKIQPNGVITLNVSLHATGYRVFEDTNMIISMRFNGVERAVLVPYSLVVNIAALGADKSTLASESFHPFPPHVNEADMEASISEAPVADKLRSNSEDGNVVSIFTKH